MSKLEENEILFKAKFTLGMTQVDILEKGIQNLRHIHL